MAREQLWSMTPSLQASIARNLGLPRSTFGEISKRWVQDSNARIRRHGQSTAQLCLSDYLSVMPLRSAAGIKAAEGREAWFLVWPVQLDFFPADLSVVMIY